MNRKTFILALLLIFVIIPSVLGAYATYRHSAFKIGDGKDIDLNGQKVGNGTISDMICTANCSNFNSTIDLTNINASINPYSVNAENISGVIPSSNLNSSFVIQTGSYTGDGTNNRPITHSLGRIPKQVIILKENFQNQNAFLMIHLMSNYVIIGTNTSEGVTVANQTVFYVASAYTNVNGLEYYWSAI